MVITWHLGCFHLRVTHSCIRAVATWKNSLLFQSGVQKEDGHDRCLQLGMPPTLYGGRLAFGSWSNLEQRLHINCLEMLAVFIALKTFLPALREHHVLVHSENVTEVAFINHQCGLRSHSFYRLAQHLLLWAQGKLLLLRAVHVPGRLNQVADMLSRDNVTPGEWRLHSQMVQMIWSVFRRAEVELFASEDNFHCPIYFSRQQDALAHGWLIAHMYAYPPGCPASSGHQPGQGSQTLSPPGGPTLEESDMVP